MNLFDMLANAQDGNGMQALARQFNLSPQQTQAAVEALLPAFSQGFKQNAADPYGFGSFLSALSSGQHAKYFEDATSAFSPQGVKEGDSILGHLFGSKDVSRAVTEQAAQATGIGQQVLKQMLPVVASMLMGGMFKQTNNQMAAGGFGQGNNPLGELIEQMMRQGGGAARQAPQQPQPQPQSGGADNPFGKMLEDILGGGRQQPQAPAPGQNPLGDNPLGDILGQILRGGQPQGQPSPRQPAPAPGSGENPLGDILEQILRGGAPQQPESYQREEPMSPPPQRRGQRQQTPSNNPLEDILGKMFNPGEAGGQVTEQYQKGIDNIFEQYRRGLDRYR